MNINGNLSEWFKVMSGMRQGCLFSPLLFSFIIDWIMRTCDKEDVSTEVIIHQRRSSRDPEISLKELDYADDIHSKICTDHQAQSKTPVH